MKSFRYSTEIIVLCILVFLVGCGSPLQKADKLASSDPKSAIALYEQVMKTKPSSEDAKQAHLRIAETYYKRMDDQQKGLEVYEEVVKSYPKTRWSGEANWAIAMHYFQAKEYGKAREIFAKVTEEIPGTELANDSALAIAKCYEELKEQEKAASLYLEFSKSHPEHRRAAQAGLDAAKIYEKGDKSDEAIEAYKFVASKYSISSSGREAREALTNMGVDLSEIDTPEVAEGPGEEGTQPQTTTETGAARRRRASNVPRAEIGSIRTATQTQPTGPTGAQQSTRTVSQDFGIDPISLIPEISIDAQGTMYDAIYMIGITYLQSGQYRESGALFEKSIQMVGNQSWENAASAYFYLGKSYKGIGNEQKAKEMFLEAIKRDPKVIDKMILDGEAQYNEEEYEKAVEYYKTALGLVPYKDFDIYYKMGLAYQKLKDTDKELDAFERSVALKPNNADALQHLAEVLYYRKSDATRAGLFDSEARGQGSNDYKVQKELADLCYKYDSYSWARTKYGNGVRIIERKINDELKKAIGSGEESKQITDDPTKINLKLVSESAASGNKLASDALQKVALLLADYRLMASRIALSQIKAKQYKDAQQQLDNLKTNDPQISSTAEYQYALGELALAQGNKDAGVTAIKKALEIDPQHQEAAEKLKELGL